MRTIRVKSATPIYLAAAMFALYGVIFPMYTLTHILIASALSVAAYCTGRRFFPGHTLEIEEELDAGDQQINRQLKESRETLKRLRETGESASSEAVRKNLSRMNEAGGKILRAVAEQPASASQVRRFMNYYLPASAKLLERYAALEKAGAGETVRGAMTRVEESLALVASAFEKQLDNLYKDEAMDISSDVRVLETMMAADGLAHADDANLLKGDH